MKRLFLVRHGETVENIREINCGHGPGALTANGRAQAKKVALRLKDENIDVIYTADLKRVMDTAKAIAKFHPKAKIVYDKRLREVDFGMLEGSPHGSVHARADREDIPFLEFRPKDGESINDLKKRVISFYKSIVKKEKGRHVLFVSSGGPITNILLHIDKAADEKFRDYHPKNTAVAIVEFPKDKARISLKGCVKHLN